MSELLLPIQRIDTHRHAKDLQSFAPSLKTHAQPNFTDLITAHAARPSVDPDRDHQREVERTDALDSAPTVKPEAQIDSDTAPPLRNSDAQKPPDESDSNPKNETSHDAAANEKAASGTPSDSERAPDNKSQSRAGQTTRPPQPSAQSNDSTPGEQGRSEQPQDTDAERARLRVDQNTRDSSSTTNDPAKPQIIGQRSIEQAVPPQPAQANKHVATPAAPTSAGSASVAAAAWPDQSTAGDQGGAPQNHSDPNQQHSPTAQAPLPEPPSDAPETPQRLPQAATVHPGEHQAAPLRANASLDPMTSTVRLGGEEGERTTTVTRLISSSTGSASVPEPPHEPVSTQTVRGMMAMIRSGAGRLTMKLEPESLGSMRIQMNISHGRVQAQFHASSLQVREMLNHQIESLRSSLESQGLRLDRVQIHALQPGPEGDAPRSGTQHNRSGHDQRHDAGDQQSRGSNDRRQSQSEHNGSDNGHRQPRSFAQRFSRLHNPGAN